MGYKFSTGKEEYYKAEIQTKTQRKRMRRWKHMANGITGTVKKIIYTLEMREC